MRFLIDANLPRAVIGVLQALGHQADFARDIGMAVLLTRDLDFADVRRYPPAEYVGIVVLRLPDTAIAQEIAQVLERFVMESKFLDAIAGRLAIVEVDRVRFRPPLTP